MSGNDFVDRICGYSRWLYERGSIISFACVGVIVVLILIVRIDKKSSVGIIFSFGSGSRSSSRGIIGTMGGVA